MRFYHSLFALVLVLSACSCEAELFLPDEPVDEVRVEDTVQTEDAPTAFAVAALKAVNEVRSKGCRCGNENLPAVPELSWSSLLAKAALAHATDMRDQDFFSHSGSDGSTLGQRVSQAGYVWQYVGENIAYGYPGLAEVMQGWIKSPGHCRNLMSANFTEIGLAETGGYWVQDFGRPR